MPCKTCNSTLIYIEDSLTCPKCEKLSVVPYQDSLKIVDHFVKIFKKMFEAEIRKYTKIHVITNVFWEREKLIRDFAENYTTIDIERLLSCNLLMRRLIQLNGFLEQEEINESKINQIIKTYATLLQFEEDGIKLEARSWNMLNSVKYELNHLEKLPLKDGIYLYPNENYDRIMQTFAKHNIMSKEKADEKLKEWKKDLVPVVPGSNKIYSARKTIERFYEMISMFYMAFFRNKLFVEAFGFPDSKKITIKPMELKRFLSLYPIQPDGPSSRDFALFRGEVIARFGGRFKQFFQNFVLSEDNLSAIPLFLKIKNTVLMSQSFTELYSYVLFAILNKNEFNDETIRRSKIFETQIVKEHFEKQGFKYIPNFSRKNKMEIDGIAISTSQVYVIEVKGWGSRKFLEEKTSKTILDKEIRNAIDGIHQDFNSGKTKHKISLPKKVSWIKDHRGRFGINDSTNIEGLLVINEQPTITEYNDCKVIFIDDFEYIKSGTRRKN